jgi:hypothetical protein
MSETSRDQEKQTGVDDASRDLFEIAREEAPNQGQGLWGRAQRFITNWRDRRSVTKQDLSRNRTQSLSLLMGGIVGAMLLFLVVFSTPPTPRNRENRTVKGPNIGRPQSEQPPVLMAKSVTPLLNAELRADELNHDLTPGDIRATSQRSFAMEDRNGRAEVATFDSNMSDIQNRRVATPPMTHSERDRWNPVTALQETHEGGPVTYRYGMPSPIDLADASSSPSQLGIEPLRRERRPETADVSKSSIVFVRQLETAAAAGNAPDVAAAFRENDALPLTPGTRLLVRLEASSTTALKSPVIAAIEYNYEREGIVVVPAGSKVIGELQQASSDGHVSLRFHTLQMANGGDEKIEGIAMDLSHGPLKGAVSGKNTGKKILSRTLSGIGTVAAYVVGGGGAGLSRTITGESLLRDRLAGNIALAGDQQLMDAAYTQNIVVTLPANIRFYVVIQKPMVEPPKSVPAGRNANGVGSVEAPTVQELRELMDLRREINRMYLDSNRTSPATQP